MKDREWSTEDIDNLKRMYQYATIGDIALELGRSLSYTRKKIAELGLKRPSTYNQYGFVCRYVRKGTFLIDNKS